MSATHVFRCRTYPTPKGKKKSSPDDSDSTDPYSSEDDGEVDDVTYRRRMYEKGPRAKGVKEIIPSRDVFEDEVRYLRTGSKISTRRTTPASHEGCQGR